MNAADILAAKIKARKGLDGAAERPLPATEPAALDGTPCGKRVPMPRHHGLHEYKQLKAALHAAEKRYRKAERSLARMKAQKGELYRKTYEIERLRMAAKERNKLLSAALKRIEELEGSAK